MILNQQHYRQVPEALGLKYHKTPREEGGFFYCPFHSEKQPSLRISFEKGIWNCFSCHRGGSLNELCKTTVGKNIFQVLGVDNEFKSLMNHKVQYTPFIEKEIKEEDVKLSIQGIVVPYNKSPEAISYLNQRGISLALAEKYQFKYADDISINHSKFMKRLLIPIYGQTGSMVNIEGRDITRKHRIKVLYPKDTIKPIWNIQKLDFKKPLYITEGLIDLFLLEEDDYFNNLTVMFGSAISPYQKKMLQNFDEIITIFNNDDAGDRATEMIREELNKKIHRLHFSKEYNDIGEIWEKDHIKVKEFREKGGFTLKRDNNFFL